MGRLIDADDLIELLQRKRKTLLGIGGNTYSIKAFDYIIAHIKEQPTAYDVEKVVAELHEFSLNTNPHCNEMMRELLCTEFSDCDYCKLQGAIEIVRKGGVE